MLNNSLFLELLVVITSEWNKLELKDYISDAEDYIKMALAEKRLPLFLMTYSEVQLKKGNNDLAEQALLETLKSDESNEHANVLLASVYVKQGRKEDAIKIINQFDSVQSAHSQKWASLRSQLD